MPHKLVAYTSDTCIVFQLYDLFVKDIRLKTNQTKRGKTTTRQAVKTRTKTVYLKRTVEKLEILERGHVWLYVFSIVCAYISGSTSTQKIVYKRTQTRTPKDLFINIQFIFAMTVHILPIS